MIADVQLTPSRQVLRAARQAADSSHGLINVVRLIQGLDDRLDLAPGVDQVSGEASAAQIEQEVPNIVYARALLDALGKGNEQSSKTQDTLREMDVLLQPMEAYCVQARRISSANSGPQPITSSAVDGSAAGVLGLASEDLKHTSSAPIGLSKSESGTVGPSSSSSRSAESTVRRRIPQKAIEDYLAQRSRLRSGEGEEGLLPLMRDTRARTATQKESRDVLMAGAAGGLGAAQIHEELGGQLADMSHQLKLNAMKFADSLEAEKALLDSSQNTLENNLVNTRSTKTQLSKVSKKGRGTTCMTFGVIILVMVLFIWTYMLIRFT